MSNELLLVRVYYFMICIGLRFLLIGGYDGKFMFGDMWWFVNEG